MTARSAISFWVWGLFDTAPNGFYDDLEGQIVELKERVKNKVKIKEEVKVKKTFTDSGKI